MRIAFLTTRTEKPSARYRFLQYIPYLEGRGHSVDVMVIPRGRAARYRLFKTLAGFDVVFLQRRLFSFLDLSILRRNSKRLIYDFDDALMYRDSKRGKQGSFLRELKFKRTVRGADAVIAGNSYLKGHSERYNKNTVVIPTTIDMERYASGESRAGGPTVTLGWIGSASTVFYLERIRGVLDKTFERHPNTRLKIVSDRFCDLDAMPVEKKMWSPDEEIADLRSFDIGLMPLTDDPWSRGKCALKLLQYMAVGVPPVCSPVGVNSEIVSHGENGFCAADERGWLDCLGRLILDGGLRKRLGTEARRTVKERYSLGVNAPRLAAVLEGGDKG